jgi:hypothetical protein
MCAPPCPCVGWPAVTASSGGGCPYCGGVLPDSTDDVAQVCRCGSGDTAGAAYWAAIVQQLLVRSGGRCEARGPHCLAGPDGTLATLPRYQVSVHHRLPRGMGGTSLPTVHALPRLLLVCGDGVRGCHGWIERNRAAATARGLLVRHGVDDPAVVPVTLWSGRVVLLAEWYLTPPGGPRWAVPA